MWKFRCKVSIDQHLACAVSNMLKMHDYRPASVRREGLAPFTTTLKFKDQCLLRILLRIARRVWARSLIMSVAPHCEHMTAASGCLDGILKPLQAEHEGFATRPAQC
eukprot:6490161-Amphidinium_carterae.1